MTERLVEIDDADLDAARAALSTSTIRETVGRALREAAVAERHRVTVLHHDGDYDSVAAVTGQSTEWVVPAGSVP